MASGAMTVNGQEFYGHLSDPSNIWNRREVYEKTWNWPKEMGFGGLKMFNVRPGLVLSMVDYKTYHPMIVHYNKLVLPVVLGFCIESGQGFGFQNSANQISWGGKRGSGFLSYQQSWQGYVTYPQHLQIQMVGFYISPSLLGSLIDEQVEGFPADIQAIIKGDLNRSFYQPITITPSISYLLHQIRNCQYQGIQKKIFLEAKTLEMFAYIQDQLTEIKNISESKRNFRSNEIKQIQEAWNILSHNLEKPPGLVELARRVGTNKEKLNQGFRQIYGNSAFELLRIRRLEKAREMLEDGEKNVTEVSLMLGTPIPKTLPGLSKNSLESILENIFAE